MTRLSVCSKHALILGCCLALCPGSAAQDQALEILETVSASQRDISLVVYSVDDPEAGLFHNADVRRPLASTMTLLVLAEFARQIHEEALDPSELVPLDSIEVYYFDGTDAGAHPAAMEALRNAGRLENDQLTLEEIANAMIQFSDNAAADYLILRFGQEAMEDIVDELDLERTDPPAPINGHFLNWVTPFVLGEDPLLSHDALALRAWGFGRRLRSASKFPDEVRDRMEGMSRRLGYQGQSAAALSFPSGTAREFAGIMARIYEGDLISDEVSATMMEYLDWPVDNRGVGDSFEFLASKTGALSGVLTSVYVADARPNEYGVDAPVTVLALFLEEVRSEVYNEWALTLNQRQLEYRLLSDPAFRQVASEFLGK